MTPLPQTREWIRRNPPERRNRKNRVADQAAQPTLTATAKKILVAIRPPGESTKGWTPRAWVPVTNHNS